VDAVAIAEVTGIGRAARWVLLFCTLIGLATMHTLGHAGVHLGVSAHATAMPGGAAAEMDAAAAPGRLSESVVAAPCSGDHCGGQPDHGGLGGWSVCLAVLGGLAAVTVLLAGLLLGHRRGPARVPGPAPVHRCAARAAPERTGLRVASVSVLRI
jgi:hypothetical protein